MSCAHALLKCFLQCQPLHLPHTQTCQIGDDAVTCAAKLAESGFVYCWFGSTTLSMFLVFDRCSVSVLLVFGVTNKASLEASERFSEERFEASGPS